MARKEKLGKSNKKPKKKLFYRIVRKIVIAFYGKVVFNKLENVPSEPCVIVGNHAKVHGPLMGEGRFPLEKCIWCDAPMFDRKEFPKYAYANFLGGKPSRFMRLMVRIINPLITYLVKNADTLPVYRDMRVMQTYRASVTALEGGQNLLIFPECPTVKNDIVNVFNEYFVDVARFYYKKTNKELQFVPSYYAVGLRTVEFGKPIKFDATAPIDEERKRICAYLEDAMTEIAKSMPSHIVIPFHSVPKDQLKKNK